MRLKWTLLYFEEKLMQTIHLMNCWIQFPLLFMILKVKLMFSFPICYMLHTHTHILRLSSSLTYFQREWWKMPNFPGHPPLWRKSHSSNLPECCAVEACVRQGFWNSEAAFQRPCTLALTPPSTHVQSCVWTVLLLLLPRKDRPGQRARILSSTERRDCGPLRAEELMGTPRQRQDSDVHIQAPETLLIIILFSTSYLNGP